jgi:two-component system cell cycle response regulator
VSTEIRVLLVEDNPRDVALARVALREMPGVDAVIEAVTRLSDAMAWLATDVADIVLLDLALPDSRGTGSVERMRAEFPDMAIVVLTGRDDDQVALAALEAGAQDYIEKARLDGHLIGRTVRYARERQRLLSEMRSLSVIDELTGARNRHGFFALVEHHMDLANRSGDSLTLFYLDVDHMKTINDTYGHNEGDRALRAVADLLRQTYRASDVIARMGGDEFCVLLTTGSRDGDSAIDRLRVELARFNDSAPLPYTLAVSIGAAGYRPDERCSVTEFVQRADAAMYEQKKSRSRSTVASAPDSPARSTGSV